MIYVKIGGLLAYPRFFNQFQSFNQKIVGGTDASIKDFPWLTLIGEVNKNDMVRIFDCGGALITKDVVLTASHCLYHQPRGGPKGK